MSPISLESVFKCISTRKTCIPLLREVENHAGNVLLGHKGAPEQKAHCRGQQTLLRKDGGLIACTSIHPG